MENILNQNKNEDITYQNVWDAAKAVPRGKFITLMLVFEKERSQINYLSLHSKKLQKEE